MRSYRRIALLALVAILSSFSNSTFSTANDISAASQPAQGASASSCGTTVDDKLAAARKALQANDNATRTALACLIEAVSTLETQGRDTVREDGTHVIAVPTYKGWHQ
jgi:hypothetical protein